MNATNVTPIFFASEALEEPVCEVIASEMNAESAFVMASVVSDVGAPVVATGDCVESVAATGDCVGSGKGEEGGETTGSFLQTQHASYP
jgi:hypothetical protein|tara:strand:- start:339 stop:605 length:267 start_codon:yes stop_codon:yes gene_type:complete